MEKLKLYLPSIVFNLAELSIIFLIGRLLKFNFVSMLVVFSLFVMIRVTLGGAMHYKSPYKCAVWSLLVFLSLFSLANAGWVISIIMTIFCAFILTTKGDWRDGLQWKGHNSNFADIDEYIKFNELNDTLLEFEKKLKEQDNLLYLLYKYRFKEHYSFTAIKEKTGLENPRISEKLDKIAFSIRIFCGI